MNHFLYQHVIFSMWNSYNKHSLLSLLRFFHKAQLIQDLGVSDFRHHEDHNALEDDTIYHHYCALSNDSLSFQ